jgi:hypothetical protein
MWLGALPPYDHIYCDTPSVTRRPVAWLVDTMFTALLSIAPFHQLLQETRSNGPRTSKVDRVDRSGYDLRIVIAWTSSRRYRSYGIAVVEARRIGTWRRITGLIEGEKCQAHAMSKYYSKSNSMRKAKLANRGRLHSFKSFIGLRMSKDLDAISSDFRRS